jgi:hypothetical protein
VGPPKPKRVIDDSTAIEVGMLGYMCINCRQQVSINGCGELGAPSTS